MTTIASPEPLPPGGSRPETTRRKTSARVIIRGALDMASGPAVQAIFDGAIDAGVDRLVVDLRGLGFMDSTGISLVLKLNRRARQAGFEVAFIPGRPRVQRILELSQVDSSLTYCDPTPDSGR